jgi:MYXO-CTERM domain-containing protein
MKKPMSRDTVPSRSFLGVLAGAALAVAALLAPATAQAQEPAACLSPNPADWPASSKPYFMIAADTSGSMTNAVGNPAIASTCGFGSDRRAHLRCAIRNTTLAYSGEVNLGLATFARKQTNCGAGCFGTCQYSDYPGNNPAGSPGCGTGSGANRSGGFIRVPMLQDSFWMNPQPADNTPAMLSWVDNVCTGNNEIFADGFTPLNGILRDMKRYFSPTGWTAQDNSVTYPTPLAMQDLAGTGVNGGTACRSVNVILITDGDETCDTQADAVAAAQDLYVNGVTVSGKTYKIRTFVINFAGGSKVNTDQIANAGGTTTSVLANNETDISIALANIIAGSAQPEVCDNIDNNCNGCTDEGSKHYCDVSQTCCPWNNAAQRTACLATFTGTISAANPTGDLTKLPCTSVQQQTEPANWLCFDPKESCDNTDNNCSGGIDEGVLKCGIPAHCPVAEVCNGQDDNCNGSIDDGVCNGCIPSAEICDGCDNDCNGLIDEGIMPLPCGLASPANCVGQLICQPKNNPGNVIGACVGGAFDQCSYTPGQEVCDNIDNDCDGIVDDSVAPVDCVPAGQPMNLNYGPNSQCKKGKKACGSNQCVGFIGPSGEVCDGLDNDCDGTVDEAVFGVGLACGINQPPCLPGMTACVNGALVCQGGVGPQAETCDGLDNNCNGVVDDPPFAEGPPAGMNGCWMLPGNCCTFQNLQWCPPPGATCNDVGALMPPCSKGTLACTGAAGWICKGSNAPAAETCDGLDNDCDGTVDNGNFPEVGQVCGTDTGECQIGAIACTAGVLDCVNDVPPSPEVCDGLDNDCDGVIDNGIQLGGSCTPDYDPVQFPNPPVFPPCQPGTLVCDGAGNTVCSGGSGPSAEICDGIDNDCDGEIDEAGAPPNGIDGTVSPSDPAVIVGAPCGGSQGECSGGIYACLNGQVICQGGQSPQPEECDCKDNNCDGEVDNGANLCSDGKDCVSGSFGCLCAELCGGGEIKCPGGQECVAGTVNGLSGNYCIPDPCPEDCGTKTVVDSGNGKVECAPADTPAGGDCIAPPVCICKGQPGCHQPCFGVVCSGGLVCSDFGAKAGTCVTDTCYNVPCQGCDTACHLGSCTDNPCVPNPCADGEVCKPGADFTSATCVGSCADVTCPSSESCVDGACQPTCPTCAQGEVCDLAQDPPACVGTKCMDGPTCTDGSCCDPLTGNCGDCPCSGVVCPSGQECTDGQCHSGMSGTGGGGGSGGTGGSTATGTTTGTDTTSGAGGSKPKGGWGLATGGGGCSCRIGGGEDDGRYALAFGALAVLFTAARRRRNARSQAA